MVGYFLLFELRSAIKLQACMVASYCQHNARGQPIPSVARLSIPSCRAALKLKLTHNFILFGLQEGPDPDAGERDAEYYNAILADAFLRRAKDPDCHVRCVSVLLLVQWRSFMLSLILSVLLYDLTILVRGVFQIGLYAAALLVAHVPGLLQDIFPVIACGQFF